MPDALGWARFISGWIDDSNAKANANLQPTINPHYGEASEIPNSEDDIEDPLSTTKNPNDTTSKYMPLTAKQAYYNPQVASIVRNENAKAAQGTQDASLVAPYLTNTDFNSIPNNVKPLLTGGSSTAASALGAENNIAAMKYGLPEQNAQTELAQSYQRGSSAGAANRLAIPQDQATVESQALRGDIARNPLVQSTLNNNAINSNFAATSITPYELKVAAIQAQGRLGTAPSEEEIRQQAISNRAVQTNTEGVYAQGANDLAPLAVSNSRLSAIREARGLQYGPTPANKYSMTPAGDIVNTPGFVPGMQTLMGNKLGDTSMGNPVTSNSHIPLGNGLNIVQPDTTNSSSIARPLRVAPITTSSISQPNQVVSPSTTKSNLQQDDDVIGHLPDGTPIYKNGALGHWFRQQFQNGPAMGGSQ